MKIWSPHTGQLVRNLTGHSKGLSDIAWSSDSVFLASASDDTTVRIWTVDTVRLVHSPVFAPGSLSDEATGTNHEDSERSYQLRLLCELQ